MRRSIKAVFAAAALSLGLFAPGLSEAAETWKIDPAHSNVGFSVRHLMVSNVKGDFNKVEGTVIWDAKNLDKSKIEATIDVASISTRDEKRDEHLRSADFFDVQKYPTMTFTSTKIERAGKDRLLAKGELSLHGVKRPATFEISGPSAQMKDPWGMTKMGATATGKLNRKEFGMVWNKALDGGGVLVGDEVTFTIEVELTMQPPEKAVAESPTEGQAKPAQRK